MKTTYLYIGLIAIIFLGLIVVRNASEPKSNVVVATQYDEFAQCITDAGAKFYGAWWCPHCNDQKNLFEKSSKLPYVECQTPSRQPIQECLDAGIESFPTWIFKDGSKLVGLQQFEDLAAKTNCAIPTP